jgi:hypothetical protein
VAHASINSGSALLLQRFGGKLQSSASVRHIVDQHANLKKINIIEI